jgi:hypothetical protein
MRSLPPGGGETDFTARDNIVDCVDGIAGATDRLPFLEAHDRSDRRQIGALLIAQELTRGCFAGPVGSPADFGANGGTIVRERSHRSIFPGLGAAASNKMLRARISTKFDLDQTFRNCVATPRGPIVLRTSDGLRRA